MQDRLGKGVTGKNCRLELSRSLRTFCGSKQKQNLRFINSFGLWLWSALWHTSIYAIRKQASKQINKQAKQAPRATIILLSI